MWQAAVEAGVRAFDTADIYAQGDSERHLGRLLRANPGRGIEVVTKAGFRHGRKADLVRLLKPVLRPLMRLKGAGEAVRQVRAEIDNQDFSPAFLSANVDGSRARLGLGALPGFILHDPEAAVLQRPEVGAFLRALKSEGRVHRTGVSLKDAAALPAALALDGLDILQMSASAWETVRSEALAQEIRARGIRLYLRQVLNREDGMRRSLKRALRDALDDPAVHSVILGLSRRKNLDTALAILSK